MVLFSKLPTAPAIEPPEHGVDVRRVGKLQLLLCLAAKRRSDLSKPLPRREYSAQFAFRSESVIRYSESAVVLYIGGVDGRC